MIAVLKGSEKQIKWAEKIRIEVLEKLEKDIAFVSKMVEKKKTPAGSVILNNYVETIEILENCSNAAAWIDTRDESFTPNKDRLAYATERFIEK